MSDFLNFSVQTRASLKEWILKMLGAPLITVELHDTQLDLVINNALEEFTKFAGQEQEYYLLDMENDYVEGVGATLPSNIYSIFAVNDETLSTEGEITRVFSVPNTLWNAGMIPIPFRGSGWLDYHLAAHAIKFTHYMTGKGFKFDYNPRTKVLTLTPDPVSVNMKGYMVLGVYTIRPETQQLGESWVRRYALAEAKILLGHIRKKFQNVALPGGGSVDTSIGDEGQAEKEKLLEDLRLSEAGPYGFYVG